MYSIFFYCFCFAYFEVIQTQNRRPSNIRKTSPQSYKPQIRILAYPLAFEQPGPGAPLLGLAKSIYLTIRLRARVFYEQIVNEAQPS